MRRLWHRTAAWVHAHPQVADGAMAAILMAVVVAIALTSEALEVGKRPYDALWFAGAVVAVAPLTLRRRWPSVVFAVTVSAVFALEALDYPDAGLGVAAVLAAYTLAAHGAPRVSRRVLGVFVPVLAAFFLVGFLRDNNGATLGNLLSNYVIFGTAWLVGDNMRRRRQRLADLEERNAQMERERDLLARQAVAEERTAIARELHDVVAHAVSVMVVQAGGARRIATTDPDRAAAALTTIELTGREALQEMRRIVGVLRSDRAEDEPADRTPAPGLAGLGALVSADPSLHVELHVEGEPTVLPSSLEVNAYRIVQEALTNVRKHAGRATAAVTVRYHPDDLELEVTDDGRGAAADHTEGGHGLIGMRERVALCGGELQVGPRVGGGWRVRARLPHQEVPA